VWTAHKKEKTKQDPNGSNKTQEQAKNHIKI
jgi:hypothetical protein